MASASYREPRPHARSAAARQEKTRGRRRISRKAPDLPHDAVRAGAESDGRLHTGTTSPEGHSGPSMGKGQLGPFAQSSPPGSHWGIRGVVEDYSIAGIQLVTGCNRLGPRNRTFNRTRSSFPYGKNDQLFDNQPRRTRRPCPCRQLLPSVAGSGGGMPHGMRSRLDGVWTRARNLPHRQQKRPPVNEGLAARLPDGDRPPGLEPRRSEADDGNLLIVRNQLVDKKANHSQPSEIQPDACHDQSPLCLKTMKIPPMTALAAHPSMDSTRASGMMTADAMSAADAA